MIAAIAGAVIGAVIGRRIGRRYGRHVAARIETAYWDAATHQDTAPPVSRFVPPDDPPTDRIG